MGDKEVLSINELERLNALSHEELMAHLLETHLLKGEYDWKPIIGSGECIKITKRNIVAVKYIMKNIEDELYSPMGNMDFKYRIGETAICKDGLYSFPQSRLKLNGKPKLENKIFRTWENTGVVRKYIVLIPKGSRMLVANGGEIISDKLKILCTYSHWQMIKINMQNLLQLKFKQ